MTSTVLVVDDESVLAGAMRDYLCRHGFAVSVRSSGEEALKTIERQPPDIVVLDYRLPRMDGLAVLRQIKESRPEVEVIMLTAHGSVESAVEAMKLGAFDYLNKPVDLEELRLVVAKALQSLKQSQELDYLRSRMDKENPSHEIVGRSEKISDVKKSAM
jgi:DNA-binding NtrC family response regulator